VGEADGARGLAFHGAKLFREGRGDKKTGEKVQEKEGGSKEGRGEGRRSEREYEKLPS